jgi:Na+-driven multidrug efflux pump
MGMGVESTRAYSKSNHRVVGLIYQRGLAINFIICILMTPVLYMSDRILLFLGYKPSIVLNATIYVWGLVPSFYLFSF